MSQNTDGISAECVENDLAEQHITFCKQLLVLMLPEEN